MPDLLHLVVLTLTLKTGKRNDPRLMHDVAEPAEHAEGAEKGIRMDG